MAVTTNQLENTNFMAPTGFRVAINRQRFPNLEFFAQSISHPSVNVSPTTVPFRTSDTFFPGDKIVYEDLQLNAILDENMTLYMEMFDWIKSFVENPLDQGATGIYRDRDKSQYDISVLVLNSHNNVIRTITYKDAFPSILGNIEFSSTTGDVQYITLPITFKYTTFTVT